MGIHLPALVVMTGKYLFTLPGEFDVRDRALKQSRKEGSKEGGVKTFLVQVA
jgi:Zn-dependent membrane protease YugP